ncbi:ABC transporter substrate-binding protein [Novisyntrophococcus fermenticellae]|uniref:ABC transporter substrate-binding protein n=1 Tax=Novisyntrophococcus fermenticellae TaxID=2068655 RepID=UPI001E5BEB00|nr:ABC transporter substrate-binding protein [Novisyntrophococcus fermenticellae]
MKKMNKIISTIIIVALFTSLTACGAKPDTAASDAATSSDHTQQEEKESLLDPANPIKVTFYSYSLGYPTMKSGMEHLINQFNDSIGKEKGVVVEGVVDDYTKWKTDVQAGNQVDIVQHTFSTLDNSAQSLGFKAYEDIFPDDELKEQFAAFTSNALSLGQIQGKTYGLAFTFSTPILYINSKLFEDAGLDPTKPPKTWDETLAAAKTIKEATGKDGFGLAPDNGWTTEGILFSNGANVLNDDQTKAVFTSDEGVEALEMWKAFYTAGVAGLGTDKDLMQEFSAGNLAMYLQSTSLYSGFKEAAEAGGWTLYGGEMPGFGDKPSVPVNSGSCLAVRPDSDQKAAAIWEFIKFVTGKEGYTIITSEIGYLPLRTDITDDPAYLKDYIDQNPILRTNLNQLTRMRPVTIWPGDVATEASAIFMDATVQSISTDADVKKVMAKAQDQINDLLGS